MEKYGLENLFLQGSFSGPVLECIMPRFLCYSKLEAQVTEPT